MPVESGIETVRETVGKVVVERTPQGCRIFVQAPAWAAILESGQVWDNASNVCGETITRKIFNKPDAVSGHFRPSYSLNYQGEPNMAPLLVEGLREGVTFNFAGIYSGEFLKKIAAKYRDFLSGNYTNFSRALRIEYTITAGNE